MKEILILLIVLVSVGKLNAQDSSVNEIKLKEHKFSVNFLINPAINYEMRVAEQMSLKFGLGLTAIIGKKGNEIGTASFFSAAYRIYYENEDPKLSYNSGSYYGVKAKIILDATDVEGSIFTPDKAVQINGIWGFQNNYKIGFYWGGTIGAGIIINTNNTIKFSPLFDLQVGFNI